MLKFKNKILSTTFYGIFGLGLIYSGDALATKQNKDSTDIGTNLNCNNFIVGVKKEVERGCPANLDNSYKGEDGYMTYIAKYVGLDQKINWDGGNSNFKKNARIGRDVANNINGEIKKYCKFNPEKSHMNQESTSEIHQKLPLELEDVRGCYPPCSTFKEALDEVKNNGHIVTNEVCPNAPDKTYQKTIIKKMKYPVGTNEETFIARNDKYHLKKEHCYKFKDEYIDRTTTDNQDTACKDDVIKPLLENRDYIFEIRWNQIIDMDFHVIDMAKNQEIYYSHKDNGRIKLDYDDLVGDTGRVDKRNILCTKNGVVFCGIEVMSIENKMKAEGNYKFFVRNFSSSQQLNKDLVLSIYNKQTKTRDIYKWDYSNLTPRLHSRDKIEILSLNVNKEGVMTITNKTNLTLLRTESYDNISTHEFQKQNQGN